MTYKATDTIFAPPATQAYPGKKKGPLIGASFCCWGVGAAGWTRQQQNGEMLQT